NLLKGIIISDILSTIKCDSNKATNKIHSVHFVSAVRKYRKKVRLIISTDFALPPTRPVRK
ncbi:MAG TPA: hypothetical protein VN922_17525, partial [Bacteroidia bacterium]|nr:hypothetical protein [Bacteroidia bacterium]